MSIHLRIKELRGDANMSQKDFANAIGVDNSQFSKIEQGKLMPTINHVMEICSNFNIKSDWLLTGEGEKSKSSMVVQPAPNKTGAMDKKHIVQDVPIYEIYAAAGLNSLFDGRNQNIIDSVRIPNLARCDGAMFVTGDSMYPLIKSGDIILFMLVNNIEYLQYGNIYVLSYTIDGDEYLVVKYVQRSSKKGFVRLVSYNEHHEPMDIPLEAIQTIALVRANVRYNTM